MIENSNYLDKLDEAEVIMRHIDEKDVVFIACALSCNNDGIWTDDGDFDKQNQVKIWKSEGVVDIFKREKAYY